MRRTARPVMHEGWGRTCIRVGGHSDRKRSSLPFRQCPGAVGALDPERDGRVPILELTSVENQA